MFSGVVWFMIMLPGGRFLSSLSPTQCGILLRTSSMPVKPFVVIYEGTFKYYISMFSHILYPP